MLLHCCGVGVWLLIVLHCGCVGVMWRVCVVVVVVDVVDVVVIVDAVVVVVVVVVVWRLCCDAVGVVLCHWCGVVVVGMGVRLLGLLLWFV